MKAVPDVCSFLSEQKYMTCTNQMTSAIYELRGMLIKVWQDAIILEQARVAGIQNLYEEIVKSNSTIYGIDQQKQLIALRDKFKLNELFTPRGMMREKELEALVALCVSFNKKVDLNSNDPFEIQKFLLSIKLENSPPTNLIKKEDIL